jgi:glycerol-3-phosphate dehydrogenase
VWQADPVTDAESAFRRDAALARLASDHFDVVVIGGGITGAGVALDAASRGLRTALVEKDDFSSGTSSKSSKMVHGGLRYLQQREIRLVYENLAERQRLLDNAPHLVSPLPFLIPLFGRNGVVSKAVARSYSTALWLYDVTGGWRIGARHHRISADQALTHLPTLDTRRLVAGFLYFDAQADDARLTLTVLRTAVVDHGAVAANYAPVVGLLDGADTRAAGVRVRAALPGGGSAPEIAVRASVVVNATGVWADDVRALDERAHPHSIRPAKGVHLTVPASRLPCDVAAVVPVPHDRRSVFVVPWPDAELTYIGTTDTDYGGSLDEPTCTSEDVDYLLDAVNAVTSSGLTRDDVTGVWAGLRPLLAPTRDQTERTADLSRRHTVHTSPHGVVTVTGGKLTTYRSMAEDTMDQVMTELGTGRTGRRCVTRSLRLRGAPDGRSSRDRSRGRSDAGFPDHLHARYGTEAGAVVALAEERPDLLDPVVAGLPYIGAEVIHAVRAEMAQTVDDVLSRRTRARIQDARAAADAARAVADLMAPELGWSDAQAADQARAFTDAALAELSDAGIPVDRPSPPDGGR